MLVDAVRARLGTEIDTLTGRVQDALDLAALIKAKQLPNVTPCAFVVPLSLRPRSEGDAAAGAFTQMVDESVAVVLVVGAQGDASGAKAAPKLDTLITSVTEAIAGWAPDGAIGNFRVSGGNLLSIDNGLVMYQLDFAIADQLRILS